MALKTEIPLEARILRLALGQGQDHELEPLLRDSGQHSPLPTHCHSAGEGVGGVEREAAVGDRG